MNNEKASKTYGYCRVSTTNQNIERQKKALLKYGVNERDIIIDELSGKDFNRANYILLKDKLLRAGDTLVITELDRFGRNYEEIKREWKELIEKGVNIVVLDMPIISTGDKGDTTKKLIANIVFLSVLLLAQKPPSASGHLASTYLLAYMAEKEREKIKERQRQGINIAKAKGKYKGRKKIESKDFERVYIQWKSGEVTAKKAMELLNMKPNTFYRRAKEYEKEFFDF